MRFTAGTASNAINMATSFEVSQTGIKRRWCGRRDLNPHANALEPKSSVSTNFTTSAKQMIE
jgi:hypothetical protein